MKQATERRAGERRLGERRDADDGRRAIERRVNIEGAWAGIERRVTGERRAADRRAELRRDSERRNS
jgi:hypothetical protein